MMGWLCFNISGAQAKDGGREGDNGEREGRFETIGIPGRRRKEKPRGENEAAGAKRTSFNRAPEQRAAAKVL